MKEKIQTHSTHKISPQSDCLPFESKARTYHERIDAGQRTARRRASAGQSRTGRRRVGSSRKHPSLLHSRASKTTVLNVSLEARTKKTRLNRIDEHNERFTQGGRWGCFVIPAPKIENRRVPSFSVNVVWPSFASSVAASQRHDAESRNVSDREGA